MVNYRQRQQALRKVSSGKPALVACLLPLLPVLAAGEARADIQSGRTASRALTVTKERPKGPVVTIPTRRDPLPGVIVKSPTTAATGKRPAPQPRIGRAHV